MVAGRLLVEDGRLPDLDLEEIYRESTRCLGELIRHFSGSAGTVFGL